MIKPFYININLTPEITPNYKGALLRANHCVNHRNNKGCNSEVGGYLQMEFGVTGVIYNFKSCYCANCIDKVLKKRDMIKVDDMDTFHSLEQEYKDYRVAQFEDMRKREQIRYETEMNTYGKVLRMSGYKGRLYVLPDYTWQYELYDGSIIKIDESNLNEAAKIIDNRVGRKDN